MIDNIQEWIGRRDFFDRTDIGKIKTDSLIKDQRFETTLLQNYAYKQIYEILALQANNTTLQYNIRLIEKTPAEKPTTGLHRQINNGE